MTLDLSKLEYVIFDWDNTLAESRSTLVLSVNRVLKEYGLPDWEAVKSRRNPDLSFRDNFPLVFGAENAVAAYERYAEIYKREVRSHISTFPGVRDVLAFFHARGCPCVM